MRRRAAEAVRRAVFAVFAWPQQGLMLLVRGYRLLLKPWLGNACRFEPSCSAYTLDALQQYGAVRGSVLGGWRLLRCHPWCSGGLDPVPENLPRLSSRLPVASVAGLFTRLGLIADASPAKPPAAPSPTRKSP